MWMSHGLLLTDADKKIGEEHETFCLLVFAETQSEPDAGQESDTNTISWFHLTVLSHRWRPRGPSIEGLRPSTHVIRLGGASLASSPQRLSWHGAQGGSEGWTEGGGAK